MSALPPPGTRIAIYARYSTDRQSPRRYCAEPDGGVENPDRLALGDAGPQGLLEAMQEMEAMDEVDIVIDDFDDGIFDDDGIEEVAS